MTKDSDFKQVVRARMAETGETYTTARAAIEEQGSQRADADLAGVGLVAGHAAYDAARIEQDRLVARLFTDGRLAQIPAKRKTRTGALLEVLSRFQPGRTYSEPEVNAVLLEVHADFAYLRRELVNYHYLDRADGRYRVASKVPERVLIEVQEIPAWEAAWLPGFVVGA